MGRITAALDALFDRSRKNVPAPGSVQSSFQLAQVLGLDYTTAMNAADPAAQIREGYNKNVIVYRCVQEVSRSAASVELVLYAKKTNGDVEEITEHPILDLIRRPNPFMGRAEFVETWIAFLALTGNTYAQAITVNGGKKIQELWPLPPDRCSPVVTRGMLTAYRVTTEGGQLTFPVDPNTGLCELLHTKSWNPSDPFRGQSPLMAAASSTDVHNEISKWTRALLANSAQPAGALVMAAAQGGVPNKLTDEEFMRLKEELSESYSGASNAGRPMLLEGGLDWKAMGLSPKEMDWLNSRNTVAREIALAFGVPPMLLGIPGDNTYSNQKEARLWFWSDTVLPLLSLALSSLNRFIEAAYPGSGLFVAYDEDKIPALAAKREEVWDRVNKSEVLKVNEKREALGYEVLDEPGGDMVFISSSVKPLDQAAAPPPDPIAMAEAVTRAKQPAPTDAGANDNARVPPAVRKPASDAAKALKEALRGGLELKYADTNWRGVELEARGRLLTAAELHLREKVKKYLRGVASEVQRVIKANDFAGVDAIIHQSRDDLEDILQAAYYGVAEVVSDRFLAAFKSSAAPETKGLLDTFWSLMSPFVEVQTARKVTLITETTRKDVQEAIKEGLQTGASMEQLADHVGNAMRDAAPGRALTIAATEAHAATSYAAEASAKSVGVEMEREWAAAGGERTRPTHQKADGQIRAMDEPFAVGGSSLMFPGDPDGAAKEVINCRCAVLYHPKGL